MAELITEHDSRTYLAWSNTLAKAIMKLGLKSTAMPKLDLKQHIANKTYSSMTPEEFATVMLTAQPIPVSVLMGQRQGKSRLGWDLIARVLQRLELAPVKPDAVP